jgi:hypothetical protein
MMIQEDRGSSPYHYNTLIYRDSMFVNTFLNRWCEYDKHDRAKLFMCSVL